MLSLGLVTTPVASNWNHLCKSSEGSVLVYCTARDNSCGRSWVSAPVKGDPTNMGRGLNGVSQEHPTLGGRRDSLDPWQSVGFSCTSWVTANVKADPGGGSSSHVDSS